MSEIDTFDNEFVGFFGKVPIYHPLVDFEAELDGEKVHVAPHQLIIGGGSGEHPAVILLKPEFAVASFIVDWLLFMEEKRPEALEKLSIKPDLWRQNTFIEKHWYRVSGKIFQFAGWSPENYHSFIERCRSEKFFYPLGIGSLINWLAESLGEFIFFSMPELIPNLYEQLPEAREHVLSGKYMNVFVPPPGYKLPIFGRKVVDGKVQYGIRWKSSQG